MVKLSQVNYHLQGLTASLAQQLYQGSHSLEKYLNLEGFLEKSLKIKPALKSTGKSLKGLKKSLYSSTFCRSNPADRDLNQYKIVVHNNFILIF